MKPNEEKMTQILDALLAKTADGKLTWEETEAVNAYCAVLQEGSVRIEKIGPDYYSLKVYNGQGVVLEEITRSATSELPQLQELHEVAHRSALGVDEALDNILSELGGSSSSSESSSSSTSKSRLFHSRPCRPRFPPPAKH